VNEPPRVPRVRWRRVSRGLYWVGAGTFLLLTTLDVLPWSFWIEAATFWPVLIVALGLRLMFERSRAPWAILLSPLVVFSTLSYVAWADRGPWQGAWAPLRAERPEGVDRWSLEGRMALANLALSSRPLPEDLLVEGRAMTRRQREALVDEVRGEARVRLGRTRRRWTFVALPRWKQKWDLGIAETLPMTMRLQVALTDAEMDLASARVTRVDVDGALNDMTLRLGVPESDVRLSWEGAFNALELIVPDEVPVRVSTDGFLNITDRRPRRSREGPGYRLRMHGAFNRVVVRAP
jgi:hypothetical protein